MERQFLVNWKDSKAARKKNKERMTNERGVHLHFCKQPNQLLHDCLKYYRNNKIAANSKYTRNEICTGGATKAQE